MISFFRLVAALREVPDPQRAEGKRYPLSPLLLFTVLALLCKHLGNGVLLGWY
jgi:hypothetical protein